jgi:hypothetical protein
MEESDTYATCLYGHRWSQKIPVKIEETIGAFSQQCRYLEKAGFSISISSSVIGIGL